MGDKMDNNASSSSYRLSSPGSVRSIVSSFEEQRQSGARPPVPPRDPNRPRSLQPPQLPARPRRERSSLSISEKAPCSNSPESTSRPHSRQSSNSGLSTAVSSGPDASNDRKKAPPRPPKSSKLRNLPPVSTAVNVAPPVREPSPFEAFETPDLTPDSDSAIAPAGDHNNETPPKNVEHGLPPKRQAFPGNSKGFLAKSTVDVKKIGVRVWERTKSTKVFQETVDDIQDVYANQRGEDGLCSNCRNLLVLDGTSAAMKRWVGKTQEWASPLSRILFHSNWCVFCRMLLNSLCQPECDPLRHPAVANHIQPNLRGSEMKSWAEQGWEFNDENWPFGHGHQRHEGGTHVLGKRFEEFEKSCWKALKIFGYHKLNEFLDPHPNVQKTAGELAHQERLREAINPRLHPLSCVLKINRPASDNSGFLQANLWGYGRQTGASVQCLSSFPLRLATLKSSNSPFSLHRYGNLLDHEWIDPSVARSWLKECESCHGPRCSVPGWASALQRPEFLRVVDVKEYRVKEIKNPKDCRYLALSYRWGNGQKIRLEKRNQRALEQKGGLLKYLTPHQQTILDAIDVVRAMGEDYLWVDALCIVQDDRVSSSKQIGLMDQIYGSALATIVAADGTGMDHGLVGIRGSRQQFTGKRRQIFQQHVKIDDTLAVAVPLSTRDYDIDGSSWNSRAWTYQERLLSRRLIFFRHGEILWHCRQMICREDMKADDSGIPLRRLDWLTLKREHFGEAIDPEYSEGCIEVTRFGVTRLVRPSTFAQYAKAVGQYTRRKIKDADEVESAFAGLSRIFSMCFHSPMTFCLPERFLGIALLWRPLEGLERREGFPSWSWSGWIGQIAYNDPFHIQYGSHGDFESCKPYATGEEGIRPFIRWLIWRQGTYQLGAVNQTGLGFPYHTNDGPPDWQSGPSYLHSDGQVRPEVAPRAHPPQCDNHLRKKCLYFWASTTAHFKLGRRIVQESDRQCPSSQPPRRYELQNSHSERVGNVLLDGVDDGWATRNRVEFVQIAETKFHQVDNEPKDIPNFPLYLVMMVEWNRDCTVATRLGIGRVYKGNWDAAQPRLKFIQLA